MAIMESMAYPAVNDPVGLGLVRSLDRPGTNVTGTTNYAPHLIGERVRLLKKLAPAATKVAMFASRGRLGPCHADEIGARKQDRGR